MAGHGANGRGQGCAIGLGVAERSGATDQPLRSTRAVPGSERKKPVRCGEPLTRHRHRAPRGGHLAHARGARSNAAPAGSRAEATSAVDVGAVRGPTRAAAYRAARQRRGSESVSGRPGWTPGRHSSVLPVSVCPGRPRPAVREDRRGASRHRRHALLLVRPRLASDEGALRLPVDGEAEGPTGSWPSRTAHASWASVPLAWWSVDQSAPSTTAGPKPSQEPRSPPPGRSDRRLVARSSPWVCRSAAPCVRSYRQ